MVGQPSVDRRSWLEDGNGGRPPAVITRGWPVRAKDDGRACHCTPLGRPLSLEAGWPRSCAIATDRIACGLSMLRHRARTARPAMPRSYAHAYTSTPEENGEFENISQDTDCIGPPCRIRTCGLRLRRPLLYPTELRAVDEKRHGSRHGPHPSEAPNDRHPPFDAPKQNGPGMKPSPKLYPITAQYRARSASRHHTGCACSMNHPKQNSPAITQYTPNAASRPRPSK